MEKQKDRYCIRICLCLAMLSAGVPAFAQNSIEGVWDVYQFPSWSQTIPLYLSWGKRDVPETYYIEIDMHSDPPTIRCNGLGVYGKIFEVTPKGNAVEFRFNVGTYLDEDDLGYNYIATFNFIEDGSVRMDPILDGVTGDASMIFMFGGKEWTFYRVDGPEEVMAADRQRRSLAFSKTHTLPYDMPLYKDYNRKLPIVAESPIITTLSKGSDVQLITVRQTEIKEDGIKLLYNHSTSSQSGEIRRTQIPGSTTETWAGVITSDGWLGWLKSDFFLPEEELTDSAQTDGNISEPATNSPESQATGEESKPEHPPLFFLLMPLSLLAVLVLLLVLIIWLIDRARQKRQTGKPE